MPRERQLKFSAYAPSSMKPIDSHHQLEEKYQALSKEFQDKEIPMSEFYCGFRFVPESILFYTLGTASFSEVIEFSKTLGRWRQRILCP